MNKKIVILVGIILIVAIGLIARHYKTVSSEEPFLKPFSTNIKVINKGNPVVIIAAADTTCDFEPKDKLECQDGKVSAQAAKENPDFVLLPGDLQYGGGGLEGYQKYFAKSWGQFGNKLKPVAGNHEYESENAKGYFEYFNGIEPYYSFDKGNWHIIGVDSNCWAVDGCNISSPQYKWLENDLQQNTKPCILAFWHHPRYTSGYHGENINMNQMWNLLAKNNAEMVLNGHDHHYERFAPKNGLREFIVGTGGRSLYATPFKSEGSEYRSSLDFGFLKLNLYDNSYTWEFHTLDDKVIDKGTANCTT